MAFFTHESYRFAYLDEGPRDGEPVLLIHGFASNKQINWVEVGWIEFLTGAGYRTIALDNRGHGDSEKLYDPDDYTPSRMAGDALALLGHLSVPKAHIMGYSMGARIASFLARDHESAVATLTLGGLGIALVEGAGDWAPVAAALLADDPSQLDDQSGMAFRVFADRSGSDRKALAACIESNRILMSRDDLLGMDQPTLIAVGEKDDIAGSPHELAALMPNAAAFDIPRRDHMLATGDKAFKARMLEFLKEHPL